MAGCDSSCEENIRQIQVDWEKLPMVGPMMRPGADGELLTLAHISDLHLPTTGGFGPRHWTLKRTLGYLNWQRGRKHRFSGAAAAALVADIKRECPDHVALTGDLVNLGLPSEIEAAANFLSDFGPPDWISVVPGNHDIYVPMKRDRGISRWGTYMASDAFGDKLMTGMRARPDGFPYVRRYGQVALIGVNSALPMPPFVAAGLVGGEQFTVLEQLLLKLKEMGFVRVIMIHHPPLAGLAPRRRGLIDAKLFEGLLSRCGAELVLHGHNHTNTLVWADGADGEVPVIGVAAGGMVGGGHGAHSSARYNILRVLDLDGTLGIEVVGRGLIGSGFEVAEVEVKLLKSRFALAERATGP